MYLCLSCGGRRSRAGDAAGVPARPCQALPTLPTRPCWARAAADAADATASPVGRRRASNHVNRQSLGMGPPVGTPVGTVTGCTALHCCELPPSVGAVALGTRRGAAQGSTRGLLGLLREAPARRGERGGAARRRRDAGCGTWSRTDTADARPALRGQTFPSAGPAQRHSGATPPPPPPPLHPCRYALATP